MVEALRRPFVGVRPGGSARLHDLLPAIPPPGIGGLFGSDESSRLSADAERAKSAATAHKTLAMAHSNNRGLRASARILAGLLKTALVLQPGSAPVPPFLSDTLEPPYVDNMVWETSTRLGGASYLQLMVYKEPPPQKESKATAAGSPVYVKVMRLHLPGNPVGHQVEVRENTRNEWQLILHEVKANGTKLKIKEIQGYHGIRDEQAVQKNLNANQLSPEVIHLMTSRGLMLYWDQLAATRQFIGREGDRFWQLESQAPWKMPTFWRDRLAANKRRKSQLVGDSRPSPTGALKATYLPGAAPTALSTDDEPTAGTVINTLNPPEPAQKGDNNSATPELLSVTQPATLEPTVNNNLLAPQKATLEALQDVLRPYTAKNARLDVQPAVLMTSTPPKLSASVPGITGEQIVDERMITLRLKGEPARLQRLIHYDPGRGTYMFRGALYTGVFAKKPLVRFSFGLDGFREIITTKPPLTLTSQNAFQDSVWTEAHHQEFGALIRFWNEVLFSHDDVTTELFKSYNPTDPETRRLRLLVPRLFCHVFDKVQILAVPPELVQSAFLIQTSGDKPLPYLIGYPVGDPEAFSGERIFLGIRPSFSWTQLQEIITTGGSLEDALLICGFSRRACQKRAASIPTLQAALANQTEAKVEAGSTENSNPDAVRPTLAIPTHGRKKRERFDPTKVEALLRLLSTKGASLKDACNQVGLSLNTLNGKRANDPELDKKIRSASFKFKVRKYLPVIKLLKSGKASSPAEAYRLTNLPKPHSDFYLMELIRKAAAMGKEKREQASKR